ncbi:hypothetical protein LPJGGPFB_02536 [Ensifer adhaerens]|nr:hypothetical protein [Ensifer adhaerens]
MHQNVAEDLITLENILRRVPATIATADAISTVAGSIRRAARTMQRIVGQVPLPLPRRQGIRPSQAIMDSATMRFSFAGPPPDGKIEDVETEIQVCIRGRLQLAIGSVALEDHWRIDTHADHKYSSQAKEGHPQFHFQRGGHAQDDFSSGPGFVPGPALKAADEGWRGLMQYPGPRVAIVPMCPTAAIDYVLSQHDGRLWRRLKSDPDYSNLINQCQNRMWSMYSQALLDANRREKILGYS